MIFPKSVSLLLKVISSVLILSFTLWLILDPIQNYFLERVLTESLQEDLQRYAQEDSNDLNTEFKSARATTSLLVEQANIQSYARNSLNADNSDKVKHWHHIFPPWLPSESKAQRYLNARYVTLLNGHGKLKEIFHNTARTINIDSHSIEQEIEKLVNGSLLQKMSHEFYYLTEFSNQPYLIVGALIRERFERDKTLGTILMFIPLDSDFLFHSKNVIDADRLMLLVDNYTHKVLASSLDEIEEGSELSSLEPQYMMLQRKFFDYENSDLEIGMVSLLAKNKVVKYQKSIMYSSRLQRLFLAVCFVLFFIILTSLFIGRIKRLSTHMQNFSSSELGVELPLDHQGDELQEVETLFNSLTTEIKQARVRLERETAKKQSYLDKMVESQRQLVQAQKMEAIGQLTAGIAHEINTPTQFVTDNTEFLKGSFIDLLRLVHSLEPIIKEMKAKGCDHQLIGEFEALLEDIDLEFLSAEIPLALKQSLEGLERVKIIVRAMKDFSHPGSDAKDLLNINKVIQNAVTVSTNEWKYVARIELNLMDDIPLFQGFSGKLGQVILNCIVNAAHSIQDKLKESSPSERSPQYGKITISSRTIDHHVEISILDDGKGVAKEVEKKIFDPFFTTKEVGKGTGQGLSLAHAIIVDLHQGTINLQHPEKGGAQFIITLPTKESPEES